MEYRTLNGIDIFAFDSVSEVGIGYKDHRKPTEEELTLWEAKKYKEKRVAEYPEIGDQLDAIMKWAFTEKEIGLPDELKSLAAQCMAVKSKYPKPESEV